MPRFSLSDREGGMFDGIKSRLGFGGDAADDRRSSRRSRDDDYDDYEYDDYDDYDYDDYDSGSTSARSGRDEGYDDYDDGYTPRSSSYDEGGYRPVDTSYSSRRSGVDYPNLVTMADVKMSTPLPEIPPIEPLPEDAGYTPSRTVVDNTAPAPYSPAHRAATEQGYSRSEGLESLFNATPSAGTMRALKVIKPVSYEDAEGVARGLKAGAVVVLALRNTPDNLRTRILDFAFGVASALDANVECPGEKVFAIAKGRALDEAEKTQLRNQGVL